MFRIPWAGLMVALLAFGIGQGLASAQKRDDGELAKKVYKIFERSCFECHGKGGQSSGGPDNILDHKSVLEARGVAEKPEKSRIFKRMGIVKDMPPTPDEDARAKDVIRPSEADIALVKTWIDTGSPPWSFDEAKPRPIVTLADEFQSMRDFLRKKGRDDRPYQRFFTLRHLHNAPQDQVNDAEYRLYQAALSKLINSLSWKPAIVVPEAVDKNKTLFAADVRKLDWDRHNLWGEILKQYPYALRHDRYPDDKDLNDLADEVYSILGTIVPVIRADWFIASASRPPLYHMLLQLPDNSFELERMLKVDVYSNIQRGQLARAGFTTSRVSGHNRLIERHDSPFGAYWVSYDFKSSAGKGNLFVFPLGPNFQGNTFSQHAFTHDGGEIIFNLPNGLQGYFLVDGKGKRINEGPIEVVSDSKKTSGTPAIVNGLSCIACHAHGMRDDFKDVVREGSILAGPARDKVREMYPKMDDLAPLVARDKKRFLVAAEEAMAPFLRVGIDAKKDIQDFAEPVSVIASRYINQELNANAAALEIGVKTEKLQGAIEANPRLRVLGLFPLTKDATIKREVWETRDFVISPYQEAAREMKVGSPVN